MQPRKMFLQNLITFSLFLLSITTVLGAATEVTSTPEETTMTIKQHEAMETTPSTTTIATSKEETREIKMSPEANLVENVVKKLEKIEAHMHTKPSHLSPSSLIKLDNRIVGGVQVRIETVPYQVSVQYLWRHICGGALIGSKFVVTAAHCTDGVQDHNSFKVRAGSSVHNSGGIMRSVKKVHQHPLFNSQNIDYDVSVLELNSPVFFSKIARMIPLARAAVADGTSSLVSGWGYLAENGVGPHKLHAVSVPIVGREQCSRAYGAGAITERMICAGITDEGGRDACQGDSGGPLVADGKLVGVVSWGYGCARPKFPGVYTNVAAVREFIEKIHK